jgi:hypothetical protein
MPSPDLSALKKVTSAQEINVNSLEDQDSAFQLLMETGKYMHRLELDLEKKSPSDTNATSDTGSSPPDEPKSFNSNVQVEATSVKIFLYLYRTKGY